MTGKILLEVEQNCTRQVAMPAQVTPPIILTHNGLKAPLEFNNDPLIFLDITNVCSKHSRSFHTHPCDWQDSSGINNRVTGKILLCVKRNCTYQVEMPAQVTPPIILTHNGLKALESSNDVEVGVPCNEGGREREGRERGKQRVRRVRERGEEGEREKARKHGVALESSSSWKIPQP